MKKERKPPTNPKTREGRVTVECCTTGCRTLTTRPLCICGWAYCGKHIGNHGCSGKEL